MKSIGQLWSEKVANPTPQSPAPKVEATNEQPMVQDDVKVKFKQATLNSLSQPAIGEVNNGQQ